MARHANALFPYEEYPHTDIYETGLLAARAMEQTLAGKLTPTMAYRRIPFLLPLFRTGAERICIQKLERKLNKSKIEQGATQT